MKGGDKGLKNPFAGGWVARFRDERELLIAVKAMKESGCSSWDAVAPWPCDATNLASQEGDTHCPMKTMSIYGTCGALLGGMMLALWITATQTNHPEMIVQGRASGWSSWPDLVPPLFEATLLGAGLGIAIGFLRCANLPEWYHWFFDAPESHAFRVGGDFLIVASSTCGERAREVLEELHPMSLELVEEIEKGEGS